MNHLNQYLFVVVLILTPLLLKSQWDEKGDSIGVMPVSGQIDSVYILEDGYPISNNQKKSDQFYDSLAALTGKRNWSSELYRLIVQNPPSNDNNTRFEANRSQVFAVHQNKIIRKIIIRQLDVFGPSIFDTTLVADNWSKRMGNSIHIATNKRFITNSLFFAEGERIDPYLIAHNERVLRSIPSIQDSRFYIIPVEGSWNEVDVMIVTKDVMAYGFSWELFDVAYGQASIWNTNLLGFGHDIHYTAYYNLNREPNYGYSLTYRINNLSNTFFSLDLQHTNRYNYLSSGFNLERNFISPNIRFAGGIASGKTKRIFTLETIDSSFGNTTSENIYYDLWGGYSQPIQSRNYNLRKDFFITVRTETSNFIKRPEVREDYLYQFHNRRLYLASAGMVWQGYHLTKLVYNFGNTEDLPYGAMIKFTGGYEENEFFNRPYFGSTFSLSKCFPEYGYFLSGIDIGGFYRSEIEQGAISYNLQYITPLMGSFRHQFRNFVNLQYVNGINRFEDEYSAIESRNRIRGLSSPVLKGNKRLNMSNELVYYSPQYLLGFRFVYYWFADALIVNSNNNYLYHNPVYISTGIGVRIRNERLIFNTVQLQFTLFPLTPGLNNNDKEYLNFTNYPEYRIPEFAERKPQQVKF